MPWRGPVEGGDLAPTLGHIAAQWIEDNLRLTDGPKLGEPFVVYDEQYDHLLARCRLDPMATEDDGNDAFVHTGSMLVRGQKWGKDPILAAVDLFHAFGPCDFAGWDADGEPVGKPHPSPWIFVAALNDRQTDNTWLPLKAMLEASDLANLSGVDITLDLIRLPCGNPIERLTTTAYGRLGGRFTGGSLTEPGLMTATGESGRGSGGKMSPLRFARTLVRSVTGMQGMWMGATNTWDPTEKSYAQQVAEAKRSAVYVDAKYSRKKVDLDNDQELAEELAWLYGDSIRERGGHVSLKRLVKDVRDESAGENEVRRFFLSEILAGERALAEPDQWAAQFRDDDPLEAGESIALGFDGSRSRDATVLTACRIRDGRLFHLRTWIPECRCPEPDHKPDDCKDRRVDRVDVDQAVTNTFAGYEVWYLFADPFKWQDYLDRWAAKWPKRVVEVPTNNETRMDQLVERFTTALRNKELTHDGDTVLTEHIRNSVIAKGRRKLKVRIDDAGKLIEHYLKIVKKREGLLIDAAVSALLAYAARGHAVEDGAIDKTPPREALEPVKVSDRPTPPSGAGLDIATVGF